MRPSERLKRAAATQWRANLTHPFVRAIGAGTLSAGKFRYFLAQDYLFLIDYSRVLALASARSGGLADMTRLTDVLQSTLATEMDLHRRLCAREGVSSAALERTEAAPVTRGYTDFLVRAAYERDEAGLTAALLPCLWGYAEIGLTLRRRGLPRVARYAEWIETYAHPDFVALAAWLRGRYDRIGTASASDRDAFRTALRYELAFWGAAWTGERWKV